MSHRSKSHRVLRNVGLGIFRRLIPDRELTRIALRARPGLRRTYDEGAKTCFKLFLGHTPASVS